MTDNRRIVESGSTPDLHRRHGGYVSPDEYERNMEAIDHAEARNRQRLIDNTSHR